MTFRDPVISQREKLTAKELKLGDVIRLGDWEWSTAIVKKITPTMIHFYRPYGHNADFSYSGGEVNASQVICYVGIEEFSTFLESDQTFELYRRGGEIR